jgi:hypothetical protein
MILLRTVCPPGSSAEKATGGTAETALRRLLLPLTHAGITLLKPMLVLKNPAFRLICD